MNGLLVLSIVRWPTPLSRRRRHRKWMQKGLLAMRAEEWPKAVKCYRRATRLLPDEPVAWFQWASCALEGGDPKLAETVARQAAGVPGMDPADLLEVRAIAAWERGDHDICEGFVRSLTQISPDMASDLRADLDLQEPTPRVSSAEHRRSPSEWIDGYA